MTMKDLKIIKTTIDIGLGHEVKFLHITDTHIALDDPDLPPSNRYKFFDCAIEYYHMAAAYAKENGLVMLNTGDFLDFLSERNFEFADKYLLTTDTIYAAGNHDFCHRVGLAKEDYQYKWDQIKRSAPHLPNNLYFYSRIIDGVNFVTLDNTYYLMTDGQIELLKAEAARGYPIVLGVHNPFYNEAQAKQILANGNKCAYVVGSINAVPELQQAENSEDPIMRDTIKYARELEGNVRGTGVHACGTIICRDDITDWVPVSTAVDKETGEKMLVTQYEGAVIEDTGLIKMDFLGLKNLSIMKDAVENIRRIKGVEVDIDAIPIDDKKTYDLYCAGHTLGTFQFESAGMQKYLRELKPTVFEDLIAMNALYRPGPMDYIPDFIDRKHGRKPIEYDIPVMEKYLKDTYGITVYQEQVMLLSRLLGNFTRGEADTLRKAMGKKILAKLMELKPKFLAGGASNGHDKKVLEKIWADWEKFAAYAFNKSHATCYSWVAYQTAYLKANYPSEYMAALLSANLTSMDKLQEYMGECKRMGISVLSPDINESQIRFSSNTKGDIRFGLAAIKGVGEGAVNAIIAEREKNGPYKDIYDFCERANYSAINRKSFENIAMAGGFNSIIDFSRGKFLVKDIKDETFADALVRYGTRIQAERSNAQQSLFGGDSGIIDIQKPSIPAGGDASLLELLNKEKELIGMYLSAHPLDEYKLLLESVCGCSVADLKPDSLEKYRGKEIAVAGIVTDVKEFYLKNGTAAGSMTVMDYEGTHEFRFFRKDYENFRTRMFKDYFLLIKGRVQVRPYSNPEELEFKVESITQLSNVRESVRDIKLYIPTDILTSEFIDELVEIAQQSKGKSQLKFSLRDTKEDVYVSAYSRKYKVTLSKEIEEFIRKYELKYSITLNQ